MDPLFRSGGTDLYSGTGNKKIAGNNDLSEGLLELKKHDEENQTQYMETLRVYLEQHLSATQAARELFIHRSTFLYRLDRIKEILQSELDDPEEIFYLELSLRLLGRARERIVRTEQNSADIWKGQLFVEGDVLIKKFRYA